MFMDSAFQTSHKIKLEILKRVLEAPTSEDPAQAGQYAYDLLFPGNNPDDTQQSFVDETKTFLIKVYVSRLNEKFKTKNLLQEVELALSAVALPIPEIYHWLKLLAQYLDFGNFSKTISDTGRKVEENKLAVNNQETPKSVVQDPKKIRDKSIGILKLSMILVIPDLEDTLLLSPSSRDFVLRPIERILLRLSQILGGNPNISFEEYKKIKFSKGTNAMQYLKSLNFLQDKLNALAEAIDKDLATFPKSLHFPQQLAALFKKLKMGLQNQSLDKTKKRLKKIQQLIQTETDSYEPVLRQWEELQLELVSKYSTLQRLLKENSKTIEDSTEKSKELFAALQSLIAQSRTSMVNQWSQETNQTELKEMILHFTKLHDLSPLALDVLLPSDDIILNVCEQNFSLLSDNSIADIVDSLETVSKQLNDVAKTTDDKIVASISETVKKLQGFREKLLIFVADKSPKPTKTPRQPQPKTQNQGQPKYIKREEQTQQQRSQKNENVAPSYYLTQEQQTEILQRNRKSRLKNKKDTAWYQLVKAVETIFGGTKTDVTDKEYSDLENALQQEKSDLETSSIVFEPNLSDFSSYTLSDFQERSSFLVGKKIYSLFSGYLVVLARLAADKFAIYTIAQIELPKTPAGKALGNSDQKKKSAITTPNTGSNRKKKFFTPDSDKKKSPPLKFNFGGSGSNTPESPERNGGEAFQQEEDEIKKGINILVFPFLVPTGALPSNESTPYNQTLYGFSSENTKFGKHLAWKKDHFDKHMILTNFMNQFPSVRFGPSTTFDLKDQEKKELVTHSPETIAKDQAKILEKLVKDIIKTKNLAYSVNVVLAESDVKLGTQVDFIQSIYDLNNHEPFEKTREDEYKKGPSDFKALLTKNDTVVDTPNPTPVSTPLKVTLSDMSSSASVGRPSKHIWGDEQNGPTWQKKLNSDWPTIVVVNLPFQNVNDDEIIARFCRDSLSVLSKQPLVRLNQSERIPMLATFDAFDNKLDFGKKIEIRQKDTFPTALVPPKIEDVNKFTYKTNVCAVVPLFNFLVEADDSQHYELPDVNNRNFLTSHLVVGSSNQAAELNLTGRLAINWLLGQHAAISTGIEEIEDLSIDAVPLLVRKSPDDESTLSFLDRNRFLFGRRVDAFLKFPLEVAIQKAQELLDSDNYLNFIDQKEEFLSQSLLTERKSSPPFEEFDNENKTSDTDSNKNVESDVDSEEESDADSKEESLLKKKPVTDEQNNRASEVLADRKRQYNESLTKLSQAAYDLIYLSLSQAEKDEIDKATDFQYYKTKKEEAIEKGKDAMIKEAAAQEKQNEKNEREMRNSHPAFQAYVDSLSTSDAVIFLGKEKSTNEADRKEYEDKQKELIAAATDEKKRPTDKGKHSINYFANVDF